MLPSKIKSRVSTCLKGILKDIADSMVRQFPLGDKPYRLHIGCGGVIKPGWINIDMMKPADLLLDVTNGLPFPDKSCEVVYSEHFFEHLDWPVASKSFLKEAYRVLCDDGILRIGVPDSRYVVEKCLSDLDSFIKQAQESNWNYPSYCNTAFEYINYHFRLQGSHQFAYDFETLSSHLAEAGFKNIIRREFDPDFDSLARSSGTLYVTAGK